MAAKSNLNYSLTGRITNQQDEPLAGLTVHAYYQTPKSPDVFLEKAVTNEDGRYTIRFTAEQFKPGKESGGPDVYIVVLAGDEEVDRSKVQRNAGRRIPIDLQVELPAAEEPPEPAFQVNGVVSQPDGRPLAKVVVRAYDKGLRSQKALLDETLTEAGGRYTIGYEQDYLLDQELGSANLQIEVLIKDDADPVQSEIRYNARRLETINLTVDPDADKSEWERLQGRLRPALKDVSLAELDDAELDFIAKSYRLPVETLRPTREAARAAAATGLPDWFHFALAQQGLPVEGETLLELPENRILEALKTAEETRAIPAPGEKELKSAQQLLQRLQADHALQKPLAGHRLPAQELFELAGLPQDAQRQLARPHRA
jgi:5-hydroxyisourate hydrolase-like protein (transthyretin family)